MIVSCPSCHTRFLVPAGAFTYGPRPARCTRCDHRWRAVPPEEPAFAAHLTDNPPPLSVEALPPALVGSAPPRVAEEPPPSPTISFRRMAAGMVILILTGALAGWLVMGRDRLARDYPWLEGIYGRLGLAVNHPGEGLKLDDVHSELEFNGGLIQLAVEGKISNGTPKSVAIPDMVAVAIGAGGEAMQSWKIAAPAAMVAGGESLPFSSTITAPAGTVAAVKLSFVEPEHAP